jgi:hypothetical protein
MIRTLSSMLGRADNRQTNEAFNDWTFEPATESPTSLADAPGDVLAGYIQQLAREVAANGRA